MSWPPPPGTSLEERTKLWREFQSEQEARLACLPKSPPREEPPEEETVRWWRPSEYFDDWIYKSVRVIKAEGVVAAGELGVVIDWDDGQPMVWFTPKAARQWTHEEVMAAWDSDEPPEKVFNFPLDHLEKL